MVAARKAVESAEGFLRNVYANQALQDLRIEEIERAEDNSQWLVTLSFLQKLDVEDDSLNSLAKSAFGPSGLDRVYKLLRVTADGNVQSMRIGPLQ
jgi:hypothetical protein